MSEKKYSPKEFLVPSHDVKGHSDRFSFRVPPWISRQVQEIVTSRKFPYKTQSDVLRHAVFDHLMRLTKMEPIKSYIQQIQMENELIREVISQQKSSEFFAGLQQAISNYLSRGDIEQASRLVTTVSAHIAAIEDEYWRDRYMQELKQRFGQLLKIKGLSLKPSEAIKTESD